MHQKHERDLKEVDILFVFGAAMAVIGVVLLCYLFFLPRNFIADETGYLTQIISIARGAPEGWEIRAILYPALLAPVVWASEAIGQIGPSGSILAARIANFAVVFAGIAAVFVLGKRLAGHFGGVLAVIFTVFSWTWAWAATRLMMDVPAGAWLTLTAVIMVRRSFRIFDAVLLVVFGSMAVLTKFQTAPTVLAAGVLYLVFQPNAQMRWRSGFAMAATSAVMVGIYAVSEYLTHGHPFGSLLAFYNYNIADFDNFVTTYGACESISFYLEALPHVHSYLLPFFMVVGVLVGFYRRSIVVPIICLALVYFGSVLSVCHKETRYILPVSSLLGAIAAYGVVELYKTCHRLPWINRVFGSRSSAIISLGIGMIILVTVASLLPRNELDILMTPQEECPGFVFQSVEQLAHLSNERPFALVHPCYVPDVLVRNYKVRFEDLGMNQYTRERALRLLRSNLPSYGAILLEVGGPAERILTDEFDDLFELYARSRGGRYAIYVARSELHETERGH